MTSSQLKHNIDEANEIMNQWVGREEGTESKNEAELESLFEKHNYNKNPVHISMMLTICDQLKRFMMMDARGEPCYELFDADLTKKFWEMMSVRGVNEGRSTITDRALQQILPWYIYNIDRMGSESPMRKFLNEIILCSRATDSRSTKVHSAGRTKLPNLLDVCYHSYIVSELIPKLLAEAPELEQANREDWFTRLVNQIKFLEESNIIKMVTAKYGDNVTIFRDQLEDLNFVNLDRTLEAALEDVNKFFHEHLLSLNLKEFGVDASIAQKTIEFLREIMIILDPLVLEENPCMSFMIDECLNQQKELELIFRLVYENLISRIDHDAVTFTLSLLIMKYPILHKSGFFRSLMRLSCGIVRTKDNLDLRRAITRLVTLNSIEPKCGHQKVHSKEICKLWCLYSKNVP